MTALVDSSTPWPVGHTMNKHSPPSRLEVADLMKHTSYCILPILSFVIVIETTNGMSIFQITTSNVYLPQLTDHIIIQFRHLAYQGPATEINL
jgi:hypothetical protein